MSNDEEIENEETEENGKDNSELAEEFRKYWEKHVAKIQAHVCEAQKALMKAVAIADKYGIPFYSSVSFIGQNYSPPVLERFADLDQEQISELTGVYNEYFGEGWEHSDIC